MSTKYDNYHLCLCLEHTYYEWEKKANKCMQCEKPLYEDEIVLMPKDDFILMKKVKFIHPITGAVHTLLCEKVEGYEQRGEFYHHCTANENTVACIPMSWAMIKIE